MSRSSRLAVAAIIAATHLSLMGLRAVLKEPPGALLAHVFATPASIIVLRHAAHDRSDLSKAPILGPSIGVCLILFGWVALEVLHDAFQSLFALPRSALVALFGLTIFVAAFLGGVLQGDVVLPDSRDL